MKSIFVDTHYWVAMINPRDQWRERAVLVSGGLGTHRLVTSDEVLTEVLNYFSDARKELRIKSANEIRAILLNKYVEVVSCSHLAFLDAIDFYEARPDKGYSLTDCISMNVCRERGITDVLTHDDHFKQEGFAVLL